MDAVLTFLANHWDAIAVLAGGWLKSRHHDKTKHAGPKDIFQPKPVKK